MKKYFLPFLILVFFAQCKEPPPPSAGSEAKWIAITELASDIDESSGLAIANGKLWTHNDSGDGPFLYQIASDKAQLIRKVFVENAESVDWEELTADSTHLYVGDFGNNGGKRQNLRIYKIALSELDRKDSVQAEIIRFSYPDQKRFDLGAYKHNFDCEAMIADGDSLYLFSKNHLDNRCKLYGLPKTAGEYTAGLIDTFDSKGLITAAAYDSVEGVICLVGYEYSGGHSPYGPFVWLISNIGGRRFFDGRLERFNLPERRQTEGVESIGGGQFIISTEKENRSDAFLYNFDAKAYLQ